MSCQRRKPVHLALALCGLVLFTPGAATADAVCSTEIKDIRTDDGAGHQIPVETISNASSSSIIAGLAFDVTGATLTQQTITADVALNVITDKATCPVLRFPLGLVFRDANFTLEQPKDIHLAPSNGIANIRFESDRFAATLKEALPLPGGYRYQATRASVPSTIDGTVFRIGVVGPAPLGTMIDVTWVLTKDLPDYGLQAVAASIAGGDGLTPTRAPTGPDDRY